MRGREVAVVAALALAQAALLLSTAWDKSDVVDEPVYITSAAMLWHRGDFGFNKESPALPKWGFAASLRLFDPRFATPPDSGPVAIQERLLWSRTPEDLRRVLLIARLPTILVTVIAGVLLWLTGRRFSPLAGVLSQCLWSFSPLVLATGSLARLDAWSAAMVAGATWLAVRYVEKPGRVRLMMLGAVIGLAAACKAPTLGLLPLAIVLAGVVWRRRGGTLIRLLSDAALLCVGTGLALWCVYGFTVGRVDLSPLEDLWGEGWRGVTIGPLPFPDWFDGLAEQVGHGARGHRKFLFGLTGVEGYWWFYLGVLALKTTLAAQALFLLRIGSMFRRPTRQSLVIDAALLSYPLLLLVVMSLGNTQSEMYLLPIFPAVMLWLGRGATELPQAFGSWGRPLAIGLVLTGAAASISVHPHHLMFFNTWAGGPLGGPRYLVVSDDAGQDQRRLAEWQKSNAIPFVYYTYYTGDPEAWGLNWQSPPCTAYRTDDDPAQRRGIYALHTVEVHRPRRVEVGCLDWLTVEPPDEVIGYTIYIYRVDAARLARLRAERWTDKPFWRSGPSRPEPDPAPK